MTDRKAGSKSHARVSLEQLHIPQPCDADWSAMTTVDGERVKYCTQCDKNVFNLSAMPREAAERFVGEQLARSAGAGMCVRLYKTPDGTCVSTDRTVRRCAFAARLSWGMAAMCSLLLAAVGCDRQSDAKPIAAGPRPQLQAISGGISAPPPPTSQPVELGRVSSPNR